MTMKAVGTAAMEMVQEVELQFDEVGIHLSVQCYYRHASDAQHRY